MEKETIEEAFEIFKKQYPVLKNYSLHNLLQVARFGAKWQAEKMYTEEEVLDILCARNIELNLYESREKVEEWFKQFSKLNNG